MKEVLSLKGKDQEPDEEENSEERGQSYPMNPQSGSFGKFVLCLCLRIRPEKTHFMHRIGKVFEDVNVTGLGKVGHSFGHIADEKGMSPFVQPVPKRIHGLEKIRTSLSVNPVDVEVDRFQFRRIQLPKVEQSESKSREEKNLGLGNDVRGIIRMITGRASGEHGVEPIRVTTDEDAHEGGDTHRDEHMEGSFLRTQSGVVGKESEKRNFDPRMVKDAGGSEKQAEPNHVMPVGSGFRHDD